MYHRVIRWSNNEQQRRPRSEKRCVFSPDTTEPADSIEPADSTEPASGTLGARDASTKGASPSYPRLRAL